MVASAANTDFDTAYKKIHVSYADLNLKNDEGVAVLYRRLQKASEWVCGASNHNSKVSLKQTREARACVNNVLTRSVAKVGNQKLTAVHNG